MKDIDITPIETLSDAIEYIEDCRDVHQAWADSPEWCNQAETGSVEFHKNCVNRYQEINQILNKLNGGKT